MKALVVCYSRTGATETVARSIANKMECEIVLLEDLQKRAGVLGWIGSGRDAFLRRPTTLMPVMEELSEYDVVFVGTPVWAGTMAPAVRTFLMQQGENIRKLVVFCTTARTAKEQTLQEMQSLVEAPCLGAYGFYEKLVRTGNFEATLQSFLDELPLNDK